MRPRTGLAALLVLVLALSGTALLLPGTSALAAPILAARDLLADRLWDDGKAELSVYRGTIERYGKPRPLAVRIIVVKEAMDEEQRVKAERFPRAGRTRDVLKVHALYDFPTGTYDYHQATSAFLDRASADLAKLAMASTEGCGITYVEVLPEAAGWRHVSHSYWDGEGDHAMVLATHRERTTLAADGLALWLRRLDLKRAQRFEVNLLPSQRSGRVQNQELPTATIEVTGRADRHGLPVVVRWTGGDARARTDRYWFDPAWPHALARFEGGADPTTFARVKTMRLAYWEKNAPGDERLLAP